MGSKRAVWRMMQRCVDGEGDWPILSESWIDSLPFGARGLRKPRMFTEVFAGSPLSVTSNSSQALHDSRAYCCISSPYETWAGPPISKTRLS